MILQNHTNKRENLRMKKVPLQIQSFTPVNTSTPVKLKQTTIKRGLNVVESATSAKMIRLSSSSESHSSSSVQKPQSAPFSLSTVTTNPFVWPSSATTTTATNVNDGASTSCSSVCNVNDHSKIYNSGE